MPDVPTDAPIVFVGAGLAGYTLAKELRKLAPEQPITLITADSGALYSKPMLSNALAQGQTAQTLVQATAAEQAEKLQIDLRPNCTVSAIHPHEHRLETESDASVNSMANSLHYSKLVLALGARPRQLDFPGAELALSVNSLDDYACFRASLTPGAHVVILGAGLVGCELANDLAASGHAVTLVEAGERALQRMAPAGLSLRLQDSLQKLGVQCFFGSGASEIKQLEHGYAVSLGNGRQLNADLVLSATGLMPETALARSAGLAVGLGIQVNDQLATSAEDIYALGDCVELGGTLYSYVLPLMQQARVLASILSGTPGRLSLPALPVAVKTPACPLVLCPPAGNAQGDWHCERDDEQGAMHHFLGRDGALLGFALAGDACGQRRQLAARVPPLLA
jgi:rubredoxin-NAD+ reductase